MLAARSGPLGLGDLLDGAFRTYRAHFVRLTLIAALFYVPLGIVSTVLLGAVVGGYLDLLGVAVNEPFYGASGETAFRSSLFFLFSVFTVTILNLLCSALAYLSLTAQALHLADGATLTVLQSVRHSLTHFWRFLGTALIAGILFGVTATAAYMAMLFVFFFFALFTGLFLAPVASNEIVMVGYVGVTLVLTLAMAAMIVTPLLALAARLMAAPVTVVAERLGPLAALERSWRLSHRQTWRGMRYVFLLSVLNFVVLGLPVALLQWLLLVALPPDLLEATGGLVTGIGFLFNILWQPFLAIALTLLYFDLRVRHESYDLELHITRIEAELRPASLP
jgi:hypothetical protein